MGNRKGSRIRVLVVLIALIIFGGAFAVWNMKITDITVLGSSYYDDDELISKVFSDAKYYRTVMCFWNNSFGQKEEIPFIKTYDLTITGLHSARIVVYEKNIVGYIPYMGSYLYFDTDGYIVESSSEKLDGKLFIDGINFDYFIMNYRLPVDDDSIFMQILVISRLVEDEQLAVTKVHFDKNMNISLYIDDIRAYLGKGVGIESKLHTLKDILPKLEGEKGTLMLDNYSVVNDTVEYIFKRDAVSSDEQKDDSQDTGDVQE